MNLKGGDDWDAVGVTISDGAAIGVRSVVLAGTNVDEWALIGAGSTVIRDVPAYA
jgi:UDP-2-acetamido-3-amino-2,3-dideoxy-glucuronate N-acetyltransferase